jgi:MinD-like ATPase involved in chromosome partitioning or flagellar assembly
VIGEQIAATRGFRIPTPPPVSTPVPDQAHHLRALVRQAVAADAALAPGATIITISGASSSIGATTAAWGLATQLASLGKQTILVEANLADSFSLPLVGRAGKGGSSAADRLSTSARHTPTIVDVLSGARRAVETLVEAEENLRILPGASAACGSAPSLDVDSLQRFTEELAALARHADYILIDAGHGMNAWIDRLWQFASQVLLVAASDSASILDAYGALKQAQFHRLDSRLRLVFNRCDDANEAVPWSDRFNDTCARYLCIMPKPHATLAKHSAGGRAPCSHRHAEAGTRGAKQDAPFTRSARLLAADLIAEARTVRIPLPQREGQGEALRTQSRCDPEAVRTWAGTPSPASTRFFPDS